MGWGGTADTGLGTGVLGGNTNGRVSLPPQAVLRVLCEAGHTGQQEPGEQTQRQGQGICAITRLPGALKSFSEGRRVGFQLDSLGFNRETPVESPEAKLLLWVYCRLYLVFYTNAIFLLCNAQGHAYGMDF